PQAETGRAQHRAVHHVDRSPGQDDPHPLPTAFDRSSQPAGHRYGRFDDYILRLVFEAEVGPDIIQFEWVHLHPDEKATSAGRLADNGWRYLTIGRGTLAVRPSAIEGT